MRRRHAIPGRSSKTLNYTRRHAHALPSQRRLKDEIRTTYKRHGNRQRRSALDAHTKSYLERSTLTDMHNTCATRSIPTCSSSLVQETNQLSTTCTDAHRHSFIIRHSLRNSITEGE